MKFSLLAWGRQWAGKTKQRKIKENFSKDDYIVVKMDIEGSEFSVLDGLIRENMIEYINEIYVEFHERFFENTNLYLEKKEYYKKLFHNKGIKFFEWY